MDYLLIILLCTLSTSKVITQGAFARKNVKTVNDSSLFNGLIFVFSALLFVWRAVGASPMILPFAAVFGVLSVIFQICYTGAMIEGNISLTVLMVNLSMIIPMGVSYFVFGEGMSPLRIVGIVLTVITFFVVTEFKGKGKTSGKWLLLAVLAMLADGGANVVLKFFGESQWRDEREAFVSCAYIVAAIASLTFYLLTSRRGKGISIKRQPKIFLIAAITGAILALFQLVNAFAVDRIDGTFFFPAYTGGCIIFSVFTSIFIFKERLTVKQVVGISVGIVALVLMNF